MFHFAGLETVKQMEEMKQIAVKQLAVGTVFYKGRGWSEFIRGLP